PAVEKESSEEPSVKIKTQYKKLSGLKTTGEKIDLAQFKKPEPKKSTESEGNKRRRKRITKDTGAGNRKPSQGQGRGGQKQQRPCFCRINLKRLCVQKY
ncbi:MAG: hypothetical protein ACPGAA_01695, partial [Flavobacteriaceae bacterium]